MINENYQYKKGWGGGGLFIKKVFGQKKTRIN